MPEEEQKSLIKVDFAGDLGKPANTLIKKVSNALGVAYDPIRIILQAKAEAKANIIKTNSDLEIELLRQRAADRLMSETVRHQQNIESVAGKALHYLETNSDPEGIENDWLTNFFDKTRLITDEKMQDLLARILAEEANSPNTVSRMTVNTVQNLESLDVKKLQNLSRFVWSIDGEVTPVVFETANSILEKNSIDYDALLDLSSLSLINLNPFEFIFGNKDKPNGPFKAAYFNREVVIRIPPNEPAQQNSAETAPRLRNLQMSDTGLTAGIACFTPAGKQIVKALRVASPVEGYFDYVIAKWSEDFIVERTD